MSPTPATTVSPRRRHEPYREPERSTLTYDPTRKLFVWIGRYDDRAKPREAGFRYDGASSQTWSGGWDEAAKLYEYADDAARELLEAQGGATIADAQARADALKASRALDADIDVPAPEGLEYMAFQRGGIAYAVKRFEAGQAGVLIGDDMGLGKTIQAAGVVNALDGVIETVLVVCPASLKINWRRELDRWLVRRRYTQIAGADYFPSGAYVVIVNYDVVHKHLKAISRRTWDLLICDEAHMLKNPEARRTKAVWDIPRKRLLELTGTPVVNKPMELWSLVSQAAPEHFGQLEDFRREYGYVGTDARGRRKLAELQDLLRSTCMVRRLKSEVLTDLPPKVRQVIELPAESASPELRAEQDEAAAFLAEVTALRLEVELAKAGSEDDYSAAVNELKVTVREWMKQIAKLRHMMALAKVPAVTAHVREALEAGEKIVLFAHHHDVIDAYVKAFGSKAVKVDGTMNAAQRQPSIDAFQRDPATRLFVGSLYAAGTGITLTASSHVIFAELDWVPGIMSQAEDRCHRIGQQNSVLVQHLVLENSLDDYMAQRLVSKQKVIEASTDKGERDELADVPLVPLPDDHATAGVSRWRVASNAEGMTPARVEAVEAALLELARQDVGNAIDRRMVERLMGRSLDRREAALGRIIARKYRAELPGEIMEVIK